MNKLVRRAVVVSGGVVAAWLVVLVGLLFVRRLQRQPKRINFPHAPLAPVQVGEHELTIYNWGERVFSSMLDDIQSGKSRILMETYILRNDEVGNTFRKRLISRAQHGVHVYLIFDSLGSSSLPAKWRRFPRNIRTFEFGPVNSLKTLLKQGFLTRTHRKILLVDNNVAYLGGVNIGKEYRRRWRDTHLRLEGPLAHNVAHAFEEMWNQYHQEAKSMKFTPPVDDPCIEICYNDPLQKEFPILQQYIAAFERAERTIRISSAYFLPPQPLYAALIAAAQRGVQVEVMTPERGDVVYADWGARGLYEDLLAHGVCIWLYQQTVNHSKTCTIDGRWSTIGSANLDSLSMCYLFEINIFVHDEAFAAQMERMWEIDLQNCRQVVMEEWRKRSAVERALEVAVLPLYRWM